MGGGALGCLLLLAGAGCERNEVRVYRVPKVEPWKLPAGWEERKAGAMRAAQFAIPTTNGAAIDVSLIPIPLRSPMARPDMTADIINIWRQQMQLDPVDVATLAKLSPKVPVGRAGEADMFEMVSKEPSGSEKSNQRTVVAAIKSDDTAWFVKMTGEDAAVAGQKQVFVSFLKSLNLDFMPAPTSSAPMAAHGDDQTSHDHSAQEDSGPARPEWAVPAGWEETAPTQMLLAKFLIGKQPEAKAEITVSAFPGPVGGMLANVNRWRGQLGLVPVGEGDLSGMLTVLDLPSGKTMLVEMNGTDAKTGQPARLIGAIQERAGLTWFYKLMGNDVVAAREKDAFIGFLKTVKYPNG